MDRKLRQGGLIFLDEGGSYVSREMTCGALEGKLHAGKELFSILGKGAWPAGRKQGPAEKGRTACWGRVVSVLGKGQRPARKGRMACWETEATEEPRLLSLEGISQQMAWSRR